VIGAATPRMPGTNPAGPAPQSGHVIAQLPGPSLFDAESQPQARDPTTTQAPLKHTAPKSMNQLAASRAPLPRRANLHLNWRIRQLPPSRNAIRHPELEPATRPIIGRCVAKSDICGALSQLSGVRVGEASQSARRAPQRESLRPAAGTGR
jgi:hypothetical protein